MEQDRNKQLIKILTSEADEHILGALADIRENGSLPLLPYIIDLLVVSTSNDVIEAVIELLQDLKEQPSVNYLVAAMKDAKFKKVLPKLVECCWENGLNFSADLDFFVDLVIKSDFQLAFDAFTVLENMEHTYSEATRLKTIEHIKDQLLSIDHDRKLLLASLIDVL